MNQNCHVCRWGWATRPKQKPTQFRERPSHNHHSSTGEGTHPSTTTTGPQKGGTRPSTTTTGPHKGGWGKPTHPQTTTGPPGGARPLRGRQAVSLRASFQAGPRRSRYWSYCTHVCPRHGWTLYNSCTHVCPRHRGAFPRRTCKQTQFFLRRNVPVRKLKTKLLTHRHKSYAHETK